MAQTLTDVYRGGTIIMTIDAERIQTYRTVYPDTKFIGKRYGEKDKTDGTYGHLWNEWFNENWFAPLESQISDPSFVEDGDAYYGMCRILADETDEYWIGMIMPLDAEIPEGYDAFMIPACKTTVNGIYGKEPDVYFCDCRNEMAKLGYEWNPLSSGDLLMADIYMSPVYRAGQKRKTDTGSGILHSVLKRKYDEGGIDSDKQHDDLSTGPAINGS